jgi:cellulose synthase/poly-beta-1,6-N-acetylglucosamine synthase-like glycosyltransferase
LSIFSTICLAVFWTSTCLLCYTYVGYPLFVYLLSRIRPIIIKRGNIEPKVTILITAYNEERDIKAKLENTLRLDYPKDKLEILVASDGSTDNTDNLVRQFSARGVRLFRQEGRVGKTITQNNAVEQSSGEIIIFSDATTDYQTNVLREILPNFADETVGCVAGKLIYVDKTKSAVGKGAKGYWNYETFLKESESRFCSLIGASGCLYAVRKSAYVPMYAEACSDFLIAALIYEQGLRTIYEPNAICEEETNRQADKEFSMRVRVISQTFTDLWRNKRMLNPMRSGFYAVQLISHKVFRYAVPLFLLFTFISTAFMSPASWFFSAILVLQILFYAMAAVAGFAEKFGKKLGVLAIPLYFVLANLASVIAFTRFMNGETYARWEPIRESKESNTFGQSA